MKNLSANDASIFPCTGKFGEKVENEKRINFPNFIITPPQNSKGNVSALAGLAGQHQ
jgi:hypothetical protein